MPEYNLTEKQTEALKKIGGSYEIVSQDVGGTIILNIGKYKFSISNTGIVEELTEHPHGKKYDKKKHQLAYIMKPKQKELMEKYGQPEIVKKLENGDLVVKLKGQDWVFGYDGLNISKVDYDKKYSGKVGKATAPVTYSYTSTICKESPERCKPRQIEHVAWDADNTIWDLSTGIASGVTGKLKKIDDDTVIELGSGKSEKKSEIGGYQYDDFWTKLSKENPEWWKEEPLPEEDGEIGEIAETLVEGLSPTDKEFIASLEGITGKEQKLLALPPPPAEPVKETGEPQEINRITLLPTFRETLDRLEKAGIKSSVISLNTKGTVSRILKTFGLADRFVEIRDSWDNKGKVFKEITKSHNFCPCASIFVDDTRGNVEDVSKECGLGLVIGKDKDIEKPLDIFKFIKET